MRVDVVIKLGKEKLDLVRMRANTTKMERLSTPQSSNNGLRGGKDECAALLRCLPRI